MYGWQYTTVSGIAATGAGLAKSKAEAANAIVADIKRLFPKEPKAYLYLVQEAPDQSLFNIRSGSIGIHEGEPAYEGMAVIDKLEPKDYMHLVNATSPIAEANPSLDNFKAPPFSLSQYALIKVTSDGRIPGMLYFADPEAPLRALATWLSLEVKPPGPLELTQHTRTVAVVRDGNGHFYYAAAENAAAGIVDLYSPTAPVENVERTTWSRWVQGFRARPNGRGASPAVSPFLQHGAQQERNLRRGAQQHDKAQMDRLRKELFEAMNKFRLPSRAKNNISFPWSRHREPEAPKLDYREAVDIAVALYQQARATVNLPRNGQLHFLVRAPAVGSALPAWYFLDRVSLRDMGEASSWGSPVQLIKDESPWAAVRMNLSMYGRPEDQYLVLIDTYKKEVSGVITREEAQAKKNPGRPSSFDRAWDQAMRQGTLMFNDSGMWAVPTQLDPEGDRAIRDEKTGQLLSYSEDGWSASNVPISKKTRR